MNLGCGFLGVCSAMLGFDSSLHLLHISLAQMGLNFNYFFIRNTIGISDMFFQLRTHTHTWIDTCTQSDSVRLPKGSIGNH